jgi:2,4-dienoyl-CoA reductase [(3E)-enoyl-CoA-producing], peroxisomal
MVLVLLLWVASAFLSFSMQANVDDRRVDRLIQAAKELSEATGQECIATPADVRQPATLKDAVAKTIAQFGHIDYVICG